MLPDRTSCAVSRSVNHIYVDALEQSAFSRERAVFFIIFQKDPRGPYNKKKEKKKKMATESDI